MSRRPRSGEAAGLIAIRVTADERALWETAAKRAGTDLSSWLRQAATELVAAGKARQRGWMRVP